MTMPTQPDLNPYGTRGEPAYGSTNPPPATAPVTQTPAQTDANPLTLEGLLADTNTEIVEARKAIAALGASDGPLVKAQGDYDIAVKNSDAAGMASAGRQLDQLYQSMASANARLGAASQSRAVTLTKAITDQKLQPTQIALAQQQATLAGNQADEAQANADKIRQGAPGEQALVAQQAVLATAQANLADATAARDKATTQSAIDLAEGQAAQAQGQAKQANAQIGLINAQATTQDQVTRKTGAEATTAEAQAGVAPRVAEAGAATAEATTAQQQRTLANMPTPEQASALTQNTIGQGTANIGSTQASTAETLGNTLAKQLGPAYGLQQQMDALKPIIAQIQQTVFGPGGSGDPSHAEDLLNQYVTAAIGGDKLGAVAQNLGTLQNNAYATSAGMANQLTSSAATRANALASFGGTALGQLAALNANAPKGSTALAGAFNDVMNQMQSRMQAPQFAAATPPPAPALPGYLARFAAPAGAPPAVQAPGLPQGNTTAPVTINISGAGTNTQAQPQQSAPAQAPAQALPTNMGMPTNLASPSMQNMGMGLPAVLQQHAPATVDYLHQLWGNELSSGAVSSPFGNTIGALA